MSNSPPQAATEPEKGTLLWRSCLLRFDLLYVSPPSHLLPSNQLPSYLELVLDYFLFTLNSLTLNLSLEFPPFG